MARKYRRKTSSLSKDAVFTFRLTPGETDEGKALEVLNRFISAQDGHGRPLYSLREVLTRALLGMEGIDPDPTERKLDDLLVRVASLRDVLDRIAEEGIAVGSGRRKKAGGINIGNSYLANLKKGFED